MGLLKKLTELRSQNDKTLTLEPTKESVTKEKLSYHDDGYTRSEACQGNSHNLQSSLEAIYQDFENRCKINYNDQEILKQPYVTEKKGKKTALITKTEELDKLNSKIEQETETIAKIRQECRDVKTDPGKYLGDIDKKASAKFWIGMCFLIPLAIYIFIFYISTSFSAFFREFSLGSGFVEGMFYPQALTHALNEGPLELGFILFIPFVFFGLGYLIHMFQEQRGFINKIKIAALFVITFLFDGLLAYLIDEKLYNLNKTFNSEPFNLNTAFQSVSFWVIIFAGFVSYIVWGLVFDFVMKEHADRDKIKSFIISKQNEILDKEDNIKKIRQLISKVEEEISKLKIRISELQNIIDGFILPVMNYKALSTQFLQGWQQYISERLRIPDYEKNQFLVECKTIYDKHLASLDLNTDSYQNKVYTKKL